MVDAFEIVILIGVVLITRVDRLIWRIKQDVRLLLG